VIWRIDPQTNTVSKSIKLSDQTGQVAAGLGSVWAVTENKLWRLDPVCGAVTGRNTIAGANGIAVGDGVVWVGQGSKLLKITPT